MSTYDPGEGPPSDFKVFLAWIWIQLNRVSAALREPEPTSMRFVKRNAAPSKLYDGLTVYADGTNWNPGSGQGVYTYYGASWNKLG